MKNKQIALLCVMCSMGIFSFAEATDAEIQKQSISHIIPIVGFQLVNEDDNFVLTPAVGLQYTRLDNRDDTSVLPDGILGSLIYTQDYFTQGIDSTDANRVHVINALFDWRVNRNDFLFNIKSAAESPFVGIETFSGALIYGRQLLDNKTLSLFLGGGLFVGDFHMKVGNMNLYTLPLPTVRFTYNAELLQTSFEFLGSPSLRVVLFPHKSFRVNGSCQMDDYRSLQDFVFDCSLQYFPVKTKPFSDILSVSVGALNSHKRYVLSDKSVYEYQYYGVYAAVDASLVTLRCGCNFGGNQLLHNTHLSDFGNGMFVSIQGAYSF